MKMKGKYVDFLCKANPKHKEYIVYENGVKTLYLKLLRALYGYIGLSSSRMINVWPIKISMARSVP